MLVPQVLAGVASVALLAAAVKRWFGAGAGLLAGTALAVTPVAALMFRFNNPDALMVCLMVGAAYCLVRALERGGTRWMLGVGALLGFAFLAKMMEAFLVVPGFALVYLIAAPVDVRRRVKGLLVGGVGAAHQQRLVGGDRRTLAGVLATDDRRLTRQQHPQPDLRLQRLRPAQRRRRRRRCRRELQRRDRNLQVVQRPDGRLRPPGCCPAAAVVLVGGLAWRWRAPRTDRLRAALLLWGSWLLVSGAVFSFSSGVIHTYYTVELAPAIAALVAIGAAVLWQRRERWPRERASA